MRREGPQQTDQIQSNISYFLPWAEKSKCVIDNSRNNYMYLLTKLRINTYLVKEILFYFLKGFSDVSIIKTASYKWQLTFRGCLINNLTIAGYFGLEKLIN
jgi:hypothetical protein